MDRNFKRMGIILLASYFIFRFYFSFLSNGLQQLLLFGFIGIYVLFHLSEFKNLFMKLGKIKTVIIFAVLLYAIVLSFSFFVPILYRTRDFSYLKSHLRYVSYSLSFIVLVDMVKKYLQPENLKDEILRIYTIVCRNYVIVSIIMLVVRPLRSFWESIIYVTPRQLELVYKNDAYFARWGWAGYSGFAITLQITIGVAFLTFLIIKSINAGKTITINQVITLILLLVGNAFYGRVGLLTSLLIIGLAIMYLIISKGRVMLGIGIMGSLIILFVGLTLFKEVNPAIKGWYDWAMDPILDIIRTGRIETTSTDALKNMYFLPEWDTLLFGDGFYMDPAGSGYYMAVDVGYLRPTLFYGVFLSLIAYMVPFLVSISFVILDKKNGLLATLMMLIMFIFEFKGEVYMALIPVVIMIFYAEAVNTYKINHEFSQKSYQNLNYQESDKDVKELRV